MVAREDLALLEEAERELLEELTLLLGRLLADLTLEEDREDEFRCILDDRDEVLLDRLMLEEDLADDEVDRLVVERLDLTLGFVRDEGRE